MDDLVFSKDLDWSRKNPCNDCPFLKSSPFHEGIASHIPAYMQSIQGQRFAHTCHKTDNRESVDGPKNFPGRPQHCVGAILMLLKTGKMMDLQLPLLQAAERGEVDLKELTDRANKSSHIYNLWQFLKFYAVELEKRLRNPRTKAAIRARDRRKTKSQKPKDRPCSSSEKSP